MNRIIVIEFITLDGIIEDPDGSADTPSGGWVANRARRFIAAIRPAARYPIVLC